MGVIEDTALTVLGRHALMTVREIHEDRGIASSLRLALAVYEHRVSIRPGVKVRDKNGAQAHRVAEVTHADGLYAFLDYGDTSTKVPVTDLEVVT